MSQGERERQAGRCHVPLASQFDHAAARCLPATIAGVPSASARPGLAVQVLAGQRSAGEHVRGDQTDVGIGEHGLHRRVLNPIGPHQAVRQLGGDRQGHAQLRAAATASASSSAGQLPMPHARACPTTRARPTCATSIGDGSPSGGCIGRSGRCGRDPSARASRRARRRRPARARTPTTACWPRRLRRAPSRRRGTARRTRPRNSRWGSAPAPVSSL